MNRSRPLLALLVCAAACALPGYSQAFRVDPSPVQTVAGNVPPGALPPVYAVPGASVSLCSDPVCATPVQSYTGISAAVQCPINAAVTLPGSALCRSSAGPQGQFGFWLVSGTYYYQITPPTGPASPVYALTIGAAGGVTWASITGKPWIQPNVDNTGTVDVTLAVNAAIQTCPVGTGSNTDLGYPTGTGCVVYLPAGQFKLSSALLINKNAVWLRGAGGSATQLVQTGINQDCIDIATPISGELFDTAISDLACVNSGTATSNWAVQVIGQFFNPKIYNFRSVDFYNGVKFQDGVTFHLHDADIRHLGVNGVAIDVDSANPGGQAGGNIDNVEINCGAVSGNSVGIEVSATGGLWIDAVDTGDCGNGLLINPYGGRVAQYMFVGRIANDTSYGSNASILPNGSTSRVQSIQFDGTWFASQPFTTFSGVTINVAGGALSTNIQGVYFTGCRFYNNFKDGIDIEAGTDIDITASRFAGNYGDDVLVGSGVGRWSLKDSVLGGTTDGFTDLEVHNLEVLGGGSNNYQVIGNRFQSAIGTGTVNTNGTAVTSATITRPFAVTMGNNTLVIDGGAYLVASVADATHLTLTSPVPGGSRTGLSYFYNPTVLDGTTPSNVSANVVANNLATQEVICPTLNSVASLPSLPSYEPCIFVAGTTPLTRISQGGLTWQNRQLILIFTATTPVGIIGGSGNIANTSGAVQYTPMSCMYQAETLNWYCSGGGSASSVDWVNGVTNKPVFDVRSFGAACTGSGDDTGGIQTAVTAAQTAGGGQVLMPPGSCVVSSVTVTGANVWIRGTLGQLYGTGNTRVKLTTGSGQDGFLFAGSGPAITHNHISDIQFDGTSANAAMAYAVHVQNQGAFYYDHVSDYNVPNGVLYETCIFCYADTFDMLGLAPTTGIGFAITGPGIQFLTNFFINGTNNPCGYTCEPRAGVLIQQTGETQIDHADIEHSGTCVSVAPGANQIVEFSRIANVFCDTNGVNSFDFTTLDSTGNIHGITMDNDWGSSSGGTGFHVGAGSGGLISGIQIDGGQYYNNYLSGVDIDYGRDITVNGIRATKNTLTTAGTVTTIGTAVTLASGNSFNSLMAGRPIIINSVTYTILSVATNGSSLILTTSAGTQASPVAYTFGATPGCGVHVAGNISHVQVRNVISGVIDGLGADIVGETLNTQLYGVCVDVGTGDFIDLQNNTVWNNITADGLAIGATGAHNIVTNNPGHNPVGETSITPGGSPYTYTAGPSPEVIYLVGASVSSVVRGTIAVANSTAVANGISVYLPPNGTITITYSGSITIAKDIQ